MMEGFQRVLNNSKKIIKTNKMPDIKESIDKPLETGRQTKEIRRKYKMLEEFKAKKDISSIIKLAAIASEGKNVISDPEFYRSALEAITSHSSERSYLYAESIAQSAAIAEVNDANLYEKAVKYILTPIISNEYATMVRHENIESACRVLASIAISNEKLSCDSRINAPSSFIFVLKTIRDSVIYKEKRLEEKPNRMVEVLEQAFSAKLDPEVCRDLYADVYNYIKFNEKLSETYKIKTLAEITAKAIRAPGVSHTKLFTETIAYLKEKGETNLARSIYMLLETHKK